MFAVRRVARAPEVVEARGVVGELPHELHERELRIRASCTDRIVAIGRRHSVNLLDTNLFVQSLYSVWSEAMPYEPPAAPTWVKAELLGTWESMSLKADPVEADPLLVRVREDIPTSRDGHDAPTTR